MSKIIIDDEGNEEEKDDLDDLDAEFGKTDEDANLVDSSDESRDEE